MWPELELQVTVADLVAFQRYCFLNHPTGRKAVAKQRAVRILAGLVGVCMGVQLVGDGALWTVAGGLPMILLLVGYATIMWFAAPGMLLQSYERRLTKKLPNGYPRSRLWLDEWGISDQSAARFIRYPWAVIRGFVETPTHVFVWTSRTTAVVIPRRVGEPYVQRFLEGIRTYTTHVASQNPSGYGVSGT
jgi:hypothetical protein